MPVTGSPGRPGSWSLSASRETRPTSGFSSLTTMSVRWLPQPVARYRRSSSRSAHVGFRTCRLGWLRAPRGVGRTTPPEIAGAFCSGPVARGLTRRRRRHGRRRLVADLEPLLAAGQRDPIKLAALDASPRRVVDQRLGDPRHLRDLGHGHTGPFRDHAKHRRLVLTPRRARTGPPRRRPPSRDRGFRPARRARARADGRSAEAAPGSSSAAYAACRRSYSATTGASSLIRARIPCTVSSTRSAIPSPPHESQDPAADITHTEH